MEKLKAKELIKRSVAKFLGQTKRPAEELQAIAEFQWKYIKESLDNPSTKYAENYVEKLGTFRLRPKEIRKQMEKIERFVPRNLNEQGEIDTRYFKYSLTHDEFLARYAVLNKLHKLAIDNVVKKKEFKRTHTAPHMNLLKIWHKRDQILEGWLHKTFPRIENEEAREFRKEVAEARLAICRSNQCGFYDPNGTSEAAVMKGSESCAACGCPLAAKTLALSSECGLSDVQKEPLWPAVLTPEQEEKMKKKLGE